MFKNSLSKHETDFSPDLPNSLETIFLHKFGEVAEWPNVTDSKSVVVETRPGVRIPPSPPLTK